MKNLFTLLLLIYCSLGSAQNSTDRPNKTIFDQWQSQPNLTIRLLGNWSDLIQNKYTDYYREATMEVLSGDDSYDLKVKLKPRGKYRRRVCDMPPIKIKIDQEEINGLELKNYKTFKLVGHCSDESVAVEALEKEMLAYKMFQMISPQSYRIQKVNIHYIDIHDVLPEMIYTGFIIEDMDELEDRLDAKECDQCTGLVASEIDQTSAANVAMFQFMIGNADWSLPLARNIKLLKSKKDNQHFVIPYDFDYSAIVNPPYLSPNGDHAFKDVRDRVLLTAGIKPEALKEAILFFKNKKQDLIELVKSYTDLNRSSRKEIVSYINSFYKIIESPLGAQDTLVVPFQ